jgi:acyl-CoA synthetase (AMP-forming)/AMP-acid ligase II
MYHVNAWSLPYGALLAGAKLVLPGPLLQPAALAELMERERVSVAAGAPTVWLGLVEELERTPRDLSALRLVPCGGSSIPEVLMRRFDALAPGVLLNAWGMTETSSFGSCATLPPAADGWGGDERLRFRLSQGRAVIGVEMRLWSVGGGAEAPWDGETLGEVQVRGPWVAASYYKDRDPDRFVDGWFCTGDLAIGSSDGSFRIVDRTREVIKSGGEWISSVELEGLILAHPAVRDSAVVAPPDERWGERPVAFVALRSGASLTLGALRAWLDGKVPRFWLPDELVLLAEVPKTSVGKLDKKVLRQRYRAEHSPQVGGAADGRG